MAGGVLRWLCARRPSRRASARLVLWGVGEAKAAEPGTAAGEIMMEHAGRVVCRADAFLVGRPAPVLAVDDALEAGRTYLVVPADRVPCAAAHDGVVTAASLAALSHCASGGAGGGRSPFRYCKDEGGRTVVRVAEEFVVRAVTGGGGREGDGGGCGALCSTPELRKHYEQLVGAARGRPWSPKLDTIKEQRGGRRRLADIVVVVSPVRLLAGMDKGSHVGARTTMYASQISDCLRGPCLPSCCCYFSSSGKDLYSHVLGSILLYGIANDSMSSNLNCVPAPCDRAAF